MWKTYNSQRNKIGGDRMKFKEWFSIKGIKSEMKQVRWLTKKELLTNSITVLSFCLIMALFFFGSDAVIAIILKALGLN